MDKRSKPRLDSRQNALGTITLRTIGKSSHEVDSFLRFYNTIILTEAEHPWLRLSAGGKAVVKDPEWPYVSSLVRPRTLESYEQLFFRKPGASLTAGTAPVLRIDELVRLLDAPRKVCADLTAEPVVGVANISPKLSHARSYLLPNQAVRLIVLAKIKGFDKVLPVLPAPEEPKLEAKEPTKAATKKKSATAAKPKPKSAASAAAAAAYDLPRTTRSGKVFGQVAKTGTSKSSGSTVSKATAAAPSKTRASSQKPMNKAKSVKMSSSRSSSAPPKKDKQEPAAEEALEVGMSIKVIEESIGERLDQTEDDSGILISLAAGGFDTKAYQQLANDSAKHQSGNQVIAPLWCVTLQDHIGETEQMLLLHPSSCLQHAAAKLRTLDEEAIWSFLPEDAPDLAGLGDWLSTATSAGRLFALCMSVHYRMPQDSLVSLEDLRRLRPIARIECIYNLTAEGGTADADLG